MRKPIWVAIINLSSQDLIRFEIDVMQFKKTFSSNLQNLAVKTTMVVPPPGRDNHKKTHERSPYASALSKRYESDK